MSARDALNAYVAHESDADQAEYEKRLDAYANEIHVKAIREAANMLVGQLPDSTGSAPKAWTDAIEHLRAAADDIEAGEAKPSARDELPAGEDDLPF